MPCSDEQQVVCSPGFLVIVAMQDIASFLSIIVCIIVARRSKKSLFHINCKILVAAMLFLSIVHSIITAFLQTLQLVRYLTMTNQCQVGIAPLLCFSLRVPSNTCMVSFVLFQFMVVVERALALWKHQTYASWGPQFGYAASAFCIAASAAAVYWMMENADLEEKQPFCSVVTSRTRERIQRLCFAMSGICIAALAILLILTTLNRLAVRRKKFDLHTSYQLRENAKVLRATLPLSIFQALCYLFFSLANGIIAASQDKLAAGTFRSLLTAAYVMPYYTLISPLILWFNMKRTQKMKVAVIERIKQATKHENDEYFRMYTQMWNNTVARS